MSLQVCAKNYRNHKFSYSLIFILQPDAIIEVMIGKFN